MADAICGYLKALNSSLKTEFNIGIDNEETSVYEFAKLYKQIGENLISYSEDIKFIVSKDNKYLTDNPHRRCPDIQKARKQLNYKPKISLEEGIRRYLSHLIK